MASTNVLHKLTSFAPKGLLWVLASRPKTNKNSRENLGYLVIRLGLELLRGLRLVQLLTQRNRLGSRPNAKKQAYCLLLCDPFGARTQDPNIKSVVLYQLS